MNPSNYHLVRTVKNLGTVNPIKAAKRRRAEVSCYVGGGFASVALILAGSTGAGPLGFLLAGALTGLVAGVLFRYLPALIDFGYDWRYRRDSR